MPFGLTIASSFSRSLFKDSRIRTVQRSVRNMPGSADLVGHAAREISTLESLLSDTIAAWGYQEVRTPIVEEADLFLRKSGGELAARLYRVEDPGGARAALRPELTASTIRAFIGLADQPPLPVRWRYQGPVFRHQASAGSSGSNQLTQVGAELIGSSSHLADVETVLVACEGVRRVGVEGASVRFGHLGIVISLLHAFGLSDRAELFLLTRLTGLRDRTDAVNSVLEEARLLRLTTNGVGSDDQTPSAALAGMDSDQALAVVKQMVISFGPTWVGSRDMQDVEGRLLEKLQSSEDPAKFEAATEMLVELVATTGDAAKVIGVADTVIGSHGLDPGLLDPARELASFLSGAVGLQGFDQTWDFGFGPGLAYYTGLVFEVTHPAQADWPLAGGGRYDGLTKALGGPDLPALGFAYTAESLLAVLDRSEDGPATSDGAPLEAVVVPRRLADAAAVLAEAERLRGPDRSKAVVIHPEPGQVDAAREYAISNGARTFVMVGPEGPRSVSLEDLPN